MHALLSTLLPLAVAAVAAAVGGTIGYLSRFPIGALFGAMAGVAACKQLGLLTFQSAPWLSLCVQILIGFMLGLSFIKLTARQLKQVLGALAVVSAGMIAALLLIGWTVHTVTGMNMATAILSSAPGGLAEMSMIATSLHLSAPVVTVLHLARTVIVLAIMPYALAWMHRLDKRTSTDIPRLSSSGVAAPGEAFAEAEAPRSLRRWASAYALAATAGLAGYATGFPVGALLGALIAISAVQAWKNAFPRLSHRAKRIIQVIVGGNIGLSFTSETFASLRDIWLAAIIIPLALFALSLLLCWILVTFLGFDRLTALLSAAPAGLSDLAITADRYNIPISTALIIQLVRIFLIVLSVPIIVYTFFT